MLGHNSSNACWTLSLSLSKLQTAQDGFLNQKKQRPVQVWTWGQVSYRFAPNPPTTPGKPQRPFSRLDVPASPQIREDRIASNCFLRGLKTENTQKNGYEGNKRVWMVYLEIFRSSSGSREIFGSMLFSGEFPNASEYTRAYYSVIIVAFRIAFSLLVGSFLTIFEG